MGTDHAPVRLMIYFQASGRRIIRDGHRGQRGAVDNSGRSVTEADETSTIELRLLIQHQGIIFNFLVVCVLLKEYRII